MKILQFDLGNAVTDVQNLASSTKVNAERSERKLQMRKKYVGTGKLKPATDAKLWSMVTKTLQSDAEYQLKGVVKVHDNVKKVKE